MIAKKDSTPSPSKTTKPSVSHGGKGANLHVQKPWIKSKGGKKGGKGKVRVPNHIFKLGGTASNPAGEAICFGFNSSSGCSEAADGWSKMQAWPSYLCKVLWNAWNPKARVQLTK